MQPMTGPRPDPAPPSPAVALGATAFPPVGDVVTQPNIMVRASASALESLCRALDALPGRHAWGCWLGLSQRAARLRADGARCCHLHKPDCCDPDDCGACCENCPTCPSGGGPVGSRFQPWRRVWWCHLRCSHTTVGGWFSRNGRCWCGWTPDGASAVATLRSAAGRWPAVVWANPVEPVGYPATGTYDVDRDEFGRCVGCLYTAGHALDCPLPPQARETCPSVYPPSSTGPYSDERGWSGPLRCVLSAGHEGDRHWNTGINWRGGAS